MKLLTFALRRTILQWSFFCEWTFCSNEQPIAHRQGLRTNFTLFGSIKWCRNMCEMSRIVDKRRSICSKCGKAEVVNLLDSRLSKADFYTNLLCAISSRNRVGPAWPWLSWRPGLPWPWAWLSWPCPSEMHWCEALSSKIVWSRPLRVKSNDSTSHVTLSDVSWLSVWVSSIICKMWFWSFSRDIEEEHRQ